MRKFLFIILLYSLNSFPIAAQKEQKQSDRLNVYVDCSNTWCNMTFIRSEINVVNFLLDNQAADVYLLITEQQTGGGGSNYQLIFFGQNNYKKQTDTLTFNTSPIATDFERRDLLLKYMKLGLAPYVAKTVAAKDVTIDFKNINIASEKTDSNTLKVKDPWNYWVFRVGASGNLSADEVYKSSRLSGDFTATRITEKIKTGFTFYASKNQTIFTLEDQNGDKEKVKIKNNDYNFGHYLVKSINSHWSYGYEAAASRSTFSNNKNRLYFGTGIEYAIYPYKEVNTKFFTISYTIDARRNMYFDSTLYDKTKETLFGQSLKTNFSVNQRWGTISFGANYHNYFQDWRLLNLGVNTDINIRVTGGLSFNIYTYAELTRDQLFLPKGGATSQEVLTRRRQLASGYSFYTYFGVNYRFGSKLNNFVNPRFN